MASTRLRVSGGSFFGLGLALFGAQAVVGCSGGGPDPQEAGDSIRYPCTCTDICRSPLLLPGTLPSDPYFNSGQCLVAGPGATRKLEMTSCIDKNLDNTQILAAEKAGCSTLNPRQSYDYVDPTTGALRTSAISPLTAVQICVPVGVGEGFDLTRQTNACNLDVGAQHSPLTATSDPGLPARSEITVTPAQSTVVAKSGAQTATFAPTDGNFVIEFSNCVGAACDFIIPTLTLYKSSFTLAGQGIGDVTLLNATPLKGTKASSGKLTFTTPVDFVSSGTVGPLRTTGFGTAQPGQLTGNYNATTGAVALSGALSSADGGQSVSINLQGTSTVQHPRANAGADQSVACTGGVVHLDGSGSTSTAPGALKFYWTLGNQVLGTTPKVDVSFSAAGAQNVLLTVVDSNGSLASDIVKVNVGAASVPQFTSVPGPVTVTDCASTPNLGTATATTACGSAVTIKNNAPARFAPGRTTVTWTATAATGSSTTATQVVTTLMGDNPVCCPAGANVLIGTSNNDKITGTAGSDCILGRGAQDTLAGAGGDDYISGGDGDDIITGGPGSDRLFGGSGQNTVSGGDGDDLVCGGSGDDKLSGDAGNDLLLGLDGQDQLSGNDGGDTLDGGNGDDRLDGGAGADRCLGGSGNNTLLACEQTQ